MSEQFKPEPARSEIVAETVPDPAVSEVLEMLPADLGYHETPELAGLRRDIIAAMSADNQRAPELHTEYQDKATAMIEMLPTDAYRQAHIGLLVTMANTRRLAGWFGAALDSYYDASTEALNMSFMYPQLQVVAQFLDEVSRITPEVQDIVSACQSACRLTEEDAGDFKAMALDEAVGYACSQLIENGIDDPYNFLARRGLIDE